jgi:hypothetical protein
VERVAGIEPAYSAWKAAALPLCYTRVLSNLAAFTFWLWLFSGSETSNIPHIGATLSIKLKLARQLPTQAQSRASFKERVNGPGELKPLGQTLQRLIA